MNRRFLSSAVAIHAGACVVALFAMGAGFPFLNEAGGEPRRDPEMDSVSSATAEEQTDEWFPPEPLSSAVALEWENESKAASDTQKGVVPAISSEPAIVNASAL